MKTDNLPEHLKGLTEDEVCISRGGHGSNRMDPVGRDTLLDMFLDMLKEPMLILLLPFQPST